MSRLRFWKDAKQYKAGEPPTGEFDGFFQWCGEWYRPWKGRPRATEAEVYRSLDFRSNWMRAAERAVESPGRPMKIEFDGEPDWIFLGVADAG